MSEDPKTRQAEPDGERRIRHGRRHARRWLRALATVVVVGVVAAAFWAGRAYEASTDDDDEVPGIAEEQAIAIAAAALDIHENAFDADRASARLVWYGPSPDLLWQVYFQQDGADVGPFEQVPEDGYGRQAQAFLSPEGELQWMSVDADGRLPRLDRCGVNCGVVSFVEPADEALAEIERFYVESLLDTLAEIREP